MAAKIWGMLRLPQPPKVRVLVVDDDEKLIQSLRRSLGARGYVVFGAPDRDAAVEVAREDRVDVALVDWMLERETGDEVCAALRQLRPPPIVVVITGQTGKELEKRSYRAGACAHLFKPIDPEELDLLIRRLCEVRQSSSAPPPANCPFEFNADFTDVRVDGQSVPKLTLRQRELIRHLCMQLDSVVHWEDLARHLSLASRHATQELLSETRKVLGPHQHLIETVRGIGLRVRSKTLTQPLVAASTDRVND
jgi:DNA-binding response OmpR family regulator